MILSAQLASLGKIFNPDILIWMNTIKESRFEDTNKIFEPPQYFDFQITTWNDIDHESIAKRDTQFLFR